MMIIVDKTAKQGEAHTTIRGVSLKTGISRYRLTNYFNKSDYFEDGNWIIVANCELKKGKMRNKNPFKSVKI